MRKSSIAPRASAFKAKPSLSRRELNQKQNVMAPIKKKNVNSSAVSKGAATRKGAGLAKSNPSNMKSSYGVVSRSVGTGAAGGRSNTKPVNMSGFMRSPLNVGKTKAGAVSRKTITRNPSTHAPSPFSTKKDTPNRHASRTKPVNPYGALYSPLS